MRLFLILILLSVPLFGQRYLDSTFIPVQTHIDQVYAAAPEVNFPYTGESNTHNENLTLDIFQPQNDMAELRPAVLMVHSGAFIVGSKENEDMIKFCKNLTGKGYVTASMNYRLGMNVASQVSGERAVYRGIQDGRAAIRYLKENAGALKIDTANIFMLGSSAGAFIALHNLFMNEESERPNGTYEISNIPPTLDDGPDLGSYDAIAPNLNSGKGSHPKAVVSLWGALQDTALILPQDLESQVFLVHGTNDGTVPFGVGSPFGWGGFPPTYGSGPISIRFNDLDFFYDSYLVDGEDHEFYGCFNGNWSEFYPINEYWNIILNKTTYFLYSNLDGSLISVKTENNPIEKFTLYQNYPNPFNPVTTLTYSVPKINHQPYAHIKIIVYDALGRLITTLVDETKTAGNYSATFNAGNLSSGIYFYKIVSGSYSEIKKMVLLR